MLEAAAAKGHALGVAHEWAAWGGAEGRAAGRGLGADSSGSEVVAWPWGDVGEATNLLGGLR